MLRQSTAVEVKANTLRDPEKRTQPDAVSKTELLGLDGTKDITLDGKKLPDALKRNSNPK